MKEMGVIVVEYYQECGMGTGTTTEINGYSILRLEPVSFCVMDVFVLLFG